MRYTPAVAGPDDDETRLGPSDDSETRLELPRTPSSDSAAKPVTSSSGWLSSSGAIDHGRFPPGTLLGGRYRIVGRLGRGGMGEVYRADDLKLGQAVALKFLPGDVDRDPARLTQLHTEVRMARQVSHPNVCRVYNIDEVEGHTFISMEYVDGEDLASLLRRIGRFPEDRALAISRQICAGLAAAHERGVVHRDLKPANVMLDGSGKVRITDFGLAGAAGEAVRAGTPAYMAPEQLSGGEVTPRSDIYALGLVLYEVFTGQRALDGETMAELIRKREQSGILPPSAIVRDIDVFANAMTTSMLAVVGIVAILIFVKRAWLAWLAGVAIFVWVVIQGMFSPGTPMLDLAIGCGIIGIYIGVILRWGLLATIAALFTHFMLLRAPLTTDITSWRATAGLTHIAVLGSLGLLGAWLARQRIPQSSITNH
jgi:tRNA A-37 threonylcarbamoyl transferase component Bud32